MLFAGIAGLMHQHTADVAICMMPALEQASQIPTRMGADSSTGPVG